MEIKKDQIILRDIQIEDIDDYVRWYTTDTEWMNWDAPWESKEGIEIDELMWKIKGRINHNMNKHRSRLEVCLDSGKHIGWVTSYFINGDPMKVAVGIDIPEKFYRSQGNGRRALECWMDYLFSERQLFRLYTQTWSGNLQMIRLAARLGFQEIERRIGIREVRGDQFDAITYEITKENFLKVMSNKSSPSHNTVIAKRRSHQSLSRLKRLRSVNTKEVK